MKKTIMLLIAGLCYLVAANSQAQDILSGDTSTVLTDSAGAKYNCHKVDDGMDTKVCYKHKTEDGDKQKTADGKKHAGNCDHLDGGAAWRECENRKHGCIKPYTWNSEQKKCIEEAAPE